MLSREAAMSNCIVLIDNKEYDGEYSIEEKHLEVIVYDYSWDIESFFVESKVNYIEAAVHDYRNKEFLFSSAFFVSKINCGNSQYVILQTNFYYQTEKGESATEFSPSKAEFMSMTFYHPILIQLFTNPCLSVSVDDKEVNGKLILDSEKKEFIIQNNNIMKIEFGGVHSFSLNKHWSSLNINTDNYIRIYFVKPIREDDLYAYAKEFDAYINVYCPLGLRSHKANVTTTDDKTYSIIHRDLGETDYFEKPFSPFVKIDFLSFLENIYKTSNYRISQNKNKYILLDFRKPTSLEDQFTYYFRFVDLYMGEYIYSQTGENPSNYERLSQFVDNNLSFFDSTDIAKLDDFKNELNSLRNHYVHEGYYLPNGEFEVTRKRKLLYKKKLDYDWLYRVTRAMKYGAYRILYKDILKVDIDEERFKSATLK